MIKFSKNLKIFSFKFFVAIMGVDFCIFLATCKKSKTDKKETFLRTTLLEVVGPIDLVDRQWLFLKKLFWPKP